MHKKTILNVILGASLSLGASVVAMAVTPVSDKPLSAILQSVEKQGTVSSVERERNRWEVLVCQRRGSCSELYLDPVTGKEPVSYTHLDVYKRQE